MPPVTHIHTILAALACTAAFHLSPVGRGEAPPDILPERTVRTAPIVVPRTLDASTGLELRLDHYESETGGLDVPFHALAQDAALRLAQARPELIAFPLDREALRAALVVKLSQRAGRALRLEIRDVRESR